MQPWRAASVTPDFSSTGISKGHLATTNLAIGGSSRLTCPQEKLKLKHETPIPTMKNARPPWGKSSSCDPQMKQKTKTGTPIEPATSLRGFHRRNGRAPCWNKEPGGRARVRRRYHHQNHHLWSVAGCAKAPADRAGAGSHFPLAFDLDLSMGVHQWIRTQPHSRDCLPGSAHTRSRGGPKAVNPWT